MEGARKGEESGKNDLPYSEVILQKILQFKMKIKSFIIPLLIAGIFASCSPKIIYTPVKDSISVERRDSVIYRVDTLRIPVPVETVKEVVPPMDTLKMETSVAEAKVWADTSTKTLKGELKNKKTELSRPQVVYKEKVVYRDSLVEKEVRVPVEVEKEVKYVPWPVKMLAYLGGIAIVIIIFAIFSKLMKMKQVL